MLELVRARVSETDSESDSLAVRRAPCTVCRLPPAACCLLSVSCRMRHAACGCVHFI